MDASTAAFLDELEKVGFDMPGLSRAAAGVVTRGGAPLAIGAAGLGLTLYDILKARRGKAKDVTVEDLIGKTRGSKQVNAKKYVAMLDKTNPRDRKLVSISTKKDIPKMLKDPRARGLAGNLVAAAAERIIEKGTNARMFPGEKIDYIVTPERANPRVIEHEVGHAWDIAGKKEGLIDLAKKVLGTLWKPTYKGDVMAKEERAWEAAKPSPLRQRALESYERGFHRGRARIVAPAALGTFLMGILKATERP